MLMYSANQVGVTLKAEIDKSINLDIIQHIHGDQRRYL